MKILITGSSGLIGSCAATHFDGLGHFVWGIDNNMRKHFFGPQGDTEWNLRRLKETTRAFRHFEIDVRDRENVFSLFREVRFDAVIHCAGQPSHDKSTEIPFTDFDVNAIGTANLLEATRLYRPEAVFVFMSTNKVYGSAPNEIPLIELEKRFDYARPEDREGVTEQCRIDNSRHSIFGVSKAAADLLTQEYARTFGLKTGVFRAGCVTGPQHSGVELHGFLSHLVKTVARGGIYTIYGYGGKQVRDQIHGADVAWAFEHFLANPRPGEIYNLGGGRSNSISILECLDAVKALAGGQVDSRYDERHRPGDHICYISNTKKFSSHYPMWSVRRTIDRILGEMVDAARSFS